MEAALIWRVQTGLYQESEEQKSEQFLEMFWFFLHTDSLQTNL